MFVPKRILGWPACKQQKHKASRQPNRGAQDGIYRLSLWRF
jgi:hypothetical protein